MTSGADLHLTSGTGAAQGGEMWITSGASATLASARGGICVSTGSTEAGGAGDSGALFLGTGENPEGAAGGIQIAVGSSGSGRGGTINVTAGSAIECGNAGVMSKSSAGKVRGVAELLARWVWGQCGWANRCIFRCWYEGRVRYRASCDSANFLRGWTKRRCLGVDWGFTCRKLRDGACFHGHIRDRQRRQHSHARRQIRSAGWRDPHRGWELNWKLRWKRHRCGCKRPSRRNSEYLKRAGCRWWSCRQRLCMCRQCILWLWRVADGDRRQLKASQRWCILLHAGASTCTTGGDLGSRWRCSARRRRH